MMVGGAASLLFQFAMSQHPHILIQFIAANIRFLLTVSNTGAGNVFFWVADGAPHLTNMFSACLSFVS